MCVLLDCASRGHLCDSTAFLFFYGVDRHNQQTDTQSQMPMITLCTATTDVGNKVVAFFSTIIWLSCHQKDKPFWILMKQETMEWQWNQLDHMEISCTSLQTDNHASTSSLNFCRPDEMLFLIPN